MKILLFIDSLGAGGAQRQLVGLAAMLKEKKYDVKVITYHNDTFFLSYLKNQNIEFECIEKANIKITRTYHIYKAIKFFNPEWVISYLDTPNIISSLCKTFGLKFKLLVSERNTTQKLTLMERIKFFLFKEADIIISNSYSQENFIKSNFPSLSKKTSTITNFVDTEYFKCENPRVRNEIPQITVVSTIWPSKNTLGFIEAVNILTTKGYRFVVKWFGKSDAHLDYYQECVRKVEEYDLNNYIKLVEKTKDIKQVYLNSDYFCLPSFYEGTPNVICEAISCGLPVICSDVCDNSIYVQEGVNGFLFDPKSLQSIADKLKKALELNNDTYSKYCKQSRLIAEKKLTKEKFINNYQKIITRLN